MRTRSWCLGRTNLSPAVCFGMTNPRHTGDDTRMDDLHRRWIETPCRLVVIDEIPDPEPPAHPQPTEPPPTAGARPADEGTGATPAG